MIDRARRSGADLTVVPGLGRTDDELPLSQSAADALREELRVAQTRLRIMAENTTDLVYRTDADGIIRWASDSLPAVLGWRHEEFIGKTAFDFAHPHHAEENRELRRQLYAGEITPDDIPNPALTRFRSKTGDYLWLSAATVTVPPDLDDGFGSGGIIVSLRDVDALVRAREESEAARQEAEAARLEAEAARQLAESQRLSMDAAAIGMAIASARGALEYVNPAMAHMLDYSPKDLLGRHFTDITHPDDRAPSLEHLWRLQEGTTDGFRQRKRYLTRTGGIVWADVSTVAVRDADGHISRVVVQLVDVSAEVMHFEALQRSVRQFRILAENASDVVYQANPDGIINWVSPAMSTVLGWQPELLVGTHHHSLIAPEDRGRAAESCMAAQAGDSRACTLRYLTTDGRRRWMSITSKRVTDSEGLLLGHVVGLRDVTDEQRARQRLARSEQKFRMAMDGSPHGMALTDADGRFLDVNPALCRLLVAPSAELLSQRLSEVLAEDVDLGALTSRDRTVRHRHQLTTAAGDRVIDHAISAVSGEGDGDGQYFVHHFVDLTAVTEPPPVTPPVR